MSEPAAPRFNTALIVSLCVNLLLAGVIATAAIRFYTHQPDMPPPGPQAQPSNSPPERAQVRQLLSARYLSRLLPQKSAQIQAIADAHHAKIEKLKGEALDARREVLRVFSEPELNRADLDKALTRMQAADLAVGTEVIHAATEIAPLLSPEERKRVADWRAHHPSPFDAAMGWRRGDRPHGPHGPGGPDGRGPDDRGPGGPGGPGGPDKP